MSLEETPQRPTTPTMGTRSPKFSRSPRSPRSPRTPRKSLTPLTRHALQMSTTPIRNRLLLTPTTNKQTHVYDPLDDLVALGKIFYEQSHPKPQPPHETQIELEPQVDISIDSVPNSLPKLTTSPPKLATSPTNRLSLNQKTFESIHSINNNETSPFINESPTPKISNPVPSFVKKDVRAFARLLNESSSFQTHITSGDSSQSSSFIEDTLPITQSQSQSQSQNNPRSPSLPTALANDIPDFTYNTTFESYADTSNVALPEAILRDGSGILGMSEEEDENDQLQQPYDNNDLTNDELAEYNLSISRIEESSSSSEDEEGVGRDDAFENYVDGISDLSLVREHLEFVTIRKRSRLGRFKAINGNNTSRSIPQFSNLLIKNLFRTLRIPPSNSIDSGLFNKLTNKFLDLEINKSLNMSYHNGMKERIVYTDVFNDNNLNLKDEEIMINLINQSDIELVKDFESVLYSNQSLRKRRKKDHKLFNDDNDKSESESLSDNKGAQPLDNIQDDNSSSEVDNGIEETSINNNEEYEEDSITSKGGDDNVEDDDDVVDLNKLNTEISLSIQPESDLSDYEIPVAEEEEDEKEDSD